LSYRRGELPTNKHQVLADARDHLTRRVEEIPFPAINRSSENHPTHVPLSACASDFQPATPTRSTCLPTSCSSLIGYEQDSTLFELAGLKLSNGCRAPTFDPTTMEDDGKEPPLAGTQQVGGHAGQVTASSSKLPARSRDRIRRAI
jgi:hypothetical protein